MAKLVVREGFFLDDDSDSPKLMHVECTSNVDDERSSVASGMEFSHSVFDDNGMRQRFLLYAMSFPCSVVVSLSAEYMLKLR